MNLLFVCIGNSCRSPMAEAFANQLGEGRVRAWSAGIFALGWIEQNTQLVMAEREISLDGQSSKSLDEVPFDQMDVVVSMGLNIVIPFPPAWLGRLVQWQIPDPMGSGLDRYRLVRDLIEIKVKDLLAELRTVNPEHGTETRENCT
jgi:arsenate reductase (thioredoxin)